MSESACMQRGGDESVLWGIQNMMGRVSRLNHRQFYRISQYAHHNLIAEATAATKDYPTFPSRYYMVRSHSKPNKQPFSATSLFN